MITTDLTAFSHQEKIKVARLWNAWAENDFTFPDGFSTDALEVMLDTSSGEVFFFNADMLVCMINEMTNKLEIMLTK